jgi:hypothetical protein
MPALKGRKAELIEAPKIKMCIFGSYKTWKTRFSLQWPSTYYIDVESGAKLPLYKKDLVNSGGLYFGPEDGSQDFGLVLQEVKALLTTKHDRKTLVIDSVSELEGISIAKEEERLDDAKMDMKFGAQKKPAIKNMRRLFNYIRSIDMNVILLAHKKDAWEGSGNDRKVVGTTYDGWDKIGHKIDLLCESKLEGGQGQMIVKGSRYEAFPIGKTIPMDYAIFSQMYGKEIIEKVAVPLIPSTPEQVAEIERLIALLKIDPEEVDRWLTKAEAEEIDDLSKDHADKILTFLTDKVKGVTK